MLYMFSQYLFYKIIVEDGFYVHKTYDSGDWSKIGTIEMLLLVLAE